MDKITAYVSEASYTCSRVGARLYCFLLSCGFLDLLCLNFGDTALVGRICILLRCHMLIGRTLVQDQFLLGPRRGHDLWRI